MNCHTVTSLLCAEREHPIEGAERSHLEAHLAACPTCRRLQQDLAAAFDSWRAGTARVAVPDPMREWYAVRRRIRGADTAAATVPFWRTPLAWLVAPVAAAAIALLVLLPSDPRGDSANGKATAIARVESVEAPGGNASTMVFVDDKSGWLIVWASDANGKSG